MLDLIPLRLRRRWLAGRRLNREVLRQALYGAGLAAAGAIVGGLAVWGFPGSH